MTIYDFCHGCHQRRAIYGMGTAGLTCFDCSSHAHCYDCGEVFHKSLLSDLGDGHLTCDDCQNEVAARRAEAVEQSYEVRV